MIESITLGQYFPGESVIHRLDPRVKILWSLYYIVLLFCVPNLWGFLIFFLFTAWGLMVSKIKVIHLIKGLKPLWFLLVFTALVNMFMTPGTKLFGFWRLTATKEGAYIALYMTLRLVFLVAGTSLLTFTTSPIMLTDGIERLLSPFSKIGVPGHEIAMMMTIAIRFIPTILEETDKIMKAQIARGAEFDGSNLVKKARAMIPLLVPLFISAFRRADDLATAMECRCYHGGENRTRLKQLKFQRIDWYAVLAAPVLLTLVILSGRI